jgi:hypothetical protein
MSPEQKATMDKIFSAVTAQKDQAYMKTLGFTDVSQLNAWKASTAQLTPEQGAAIDNLIGGPKLASIDASGNVAIQDYNAPEGAFGEDLKNTIGNQVKDNLSNQMMTDLIGHGKTADKLVGSGNVKNVLTGSQIQGTGNIFKDLTHGAPTPDSAINQLKDMMAQKALGITPEKIKAYYSAHPDTKWPGGSAFYNELTGKFQLPEDWR